MVGTVGGALPQSYGEGACGTCRVPVLSGAYETDGRATLSADELAALAPSRRQHVTSVATCSGRQRGRPGTGNGTRNGLFRRISASAGSRSVAGLAGRCGTGRRSSAAGVSARRAPHPCGRAGQHQ
ncbi:2Fe-2S iron-sulfur cluster-binding protein [Streptomyces fuscichromogenes]|uniref:2Fe-2S iron-sulfur cluster-binding protein n=1 Tax=Streptomyces fuscichromogenes TaxID=1324013 RepID=UPI00381718BE